MIPSTPRLSGMRAGLALAVAATALCATPSLVAEGPAASSDKPAASIFTFPASVSSPSNTFRYQPSDVSSSSSNDAIAANDPAAALAEERDSLGDAGAQPPPGRRRSYGRSRYQDRMHNADGSTRIAFMAGAGLNLPVANTGKFYTPSWDVAVGAGYNFNKMFGILGEFHYDRMGLTSSSINYQYNNYLAYTDATTSDLAGLDANAHVLSFTVDPVINFTDARSRFGAYVTGGIGWYRKTTNFTLPTPVGGCGYYSCYSYIANVSFDSYSANGLGENVGFGLSYKLSEFSSERLFAEARYHWMNLKDNGTDFFPYNRRNSEMVPITVGIRF